MKVAIITMHCPLNYGAVLQTYALQTYIESLGHNVEIIDYNPDYIIYVQSLLYVPTNYKSNPIKRILYILFKAYNKYLKREKFSNFKNERLHLSNVKYKSFKELKTNKPEADLYICGSDQIWSFSNEAYKDPAYFLGFANDKDKKMSYAPSGHFPTPLPKEMCKAITPLINRLDYISVREGQTQKAIQQLISKPISEVLDPVFLLKSDDWKQKFDVYENSDGPQKYILVYIVGESSYAIKEAIRLSEKFKLPIINISSSQKKIRNINRTIMPTPVEFIKLFVGAEYVLTNSFHGTAFSIIFKKQFWSFSTKIASNRLVSLLDKLHIMHRLIRPGEDINEENNIDFSIVQETLNGYVYQSEQFLKQVL